jgi:hypothetical protein
MRWISGIAGQCSYGNIISYQHNGTISDLSTVVHNRTPLQTMIVLEVYKSGNHIAWIQLKRHAALQIVFQRLVILR